MANHIPEAHRQLGDPFENLANAIIAEAVYDYRNAIDDYRRKSIETFIRSERFKLLTDLDPEYIILRLREEHEQKQRNPRQKGGRKCGSR